MCGVSGRTGPDDGGATCTIGPPKRESWGRGARIESVARGRGEGDSLLAGASTRRLVEVVFGAPKS